MSLFKHNCSADGHKYEARYDTTPPNNITKMRGSPSDIQDMISALTTKTYVKDICVKCGTIVKR